MKISYVCLIYKSIKWLKFEYDQFMKYTKLNDGDEFYFVANDACEEVLDYLKQSKIKYYVYNNTESQKKEWYINNVYRAWNYAIKQSINDYIIFLNSDMAFSVDWNTNLINKIDDNKCITSRLIERGLPNGLSTMKGGHGIEKNFGNNTTDYVENDFIEFAEQIKENKLVEKGLFMPIMIKKQHLEKVNYYPEGNITEKSWNDLTLDKNNIINFSPIIAKKEEKCFSGDLVLIKKLEKIGIYHYTAFDSVVYHFQQGEMTE